MDHGSEQTELIFGEAFHLVEHDGGAEFYLLDEQTFHVVLVVVAEELFAVQKFVGHAHGVHHGDDAVEAAHRGHDFVAQRDGLGDGHGFADAARFNENVVEAAGGDEIENLLHEIVLEGAADAAVGKGNEAAFHLHVAAFFDERGVDVDFADVVDDDGDLVAFLIGKHVIEQRGLARAEVAGENGDGDYFSFFHDDLPESAGAR